MSALIEDLRAHIAARDVLVVVGAGVSIGATRNEPVASWTGLLEHGVGRCVEVSPGLPADWADRLRGEIRSSDLDDLLSAAEKIERKLGAPHGGEYRRWLRETVGALKVVDPPVLEALRDLQLPLATTNYDGLLEEATGRRAFTWRQSADVERVIRGDESGIVHLHGHWREPESVILGIRSYEKLLGDEHAQGILRAVRTVKTLLFVGFGFGLCDPNFSALLAWTQRVFAGSEYRHYRLSLEKDVEILQKEHPPAERLFVLSYGKHHSDLAPFLRQLAPEPVLEEPAAGRPSGGGALTSLEARVNFQCEVSRFTSRGCTCTGNWEPDTIQARWQQISVPRARGDNPEALGFGPGWLPGFPHPDPAYQNFHRHLDAEGRVDLSSEACSDLAPELRDAWASYRYRGVVSLPTIQLTTQLALSIPQTGPVTITGADAARYREHRLLIVNADEEPVESLRMRIQFPEAITPDPTVVQRPAGVELVWRPEPSPAAALVEGGATVTVTGNFGIVGNYFLDVSRLLPGAEIELRLLSEAHRALGETDAAITSNNAGGCLLFHILGTFQYRWRDSYYERKFLIALNYDRSARRVFSLPSEEDTGERQVRMRAALAADRPAGLPE